MTCHGVVIATAIVKGILRLSHLEKQIIAAAVAAAVAAPAAMAGAPTVYGQINMSLEQVTQKDAAGSTVDQDSGTAITSNNSRLGVKGSQDLGNGLKAIYKMEFAVSTDVTKNGGLLKGRNAYVGLAGGFGAVLLGRHDTPFKMAQPKDTFNDGRGDNNPMAGHLGVLKKGGEIRASNVLVFQWHQVRRCPGTKGNRW
jgi:predicted porin